MDFVLACLCSVGGSLNGLCYKENGTCFCREGIGGLKCDICARGYNGSAPECSKCGECFDNWDFVISSLSGNNIKK